MSKAQNSMSWFKDYTWEEKKHWPTFIALITKAEAAFLACEYKELIVIVKDALNEGNDELEQNIILRCMLNEALCELSKYEEAYAVINNYEENIILPHKLQAELLLRIGATCNWLGQYPKATAKLTESLRIFTMLNDQEGIMRADLELSSVYIHINEYIIARDYVQRSLASADLLNHHRIVGKALLFLGILDHYDGNFASAKKHYLQALQVLEGSRDYRLLGFLHTNLANTLFFEERGTTDQIISSCEKATEYFNMLDNSDFIALCYNNLSDCLLRFGHWDKADVMINKALDHARKANDRYTEGLALITRGELNLCRGNFTYAKRQLIEAVKVCGQLDKSVLSHAKRALGYCYKVGQQPAFKVFQEALQLATSVGDHDEITFSQIALAEHFFARENLDEAHKYLKQAEERLSHKPSPYISGFLQRLIGSIKAIEGKNAEAIEHLNLSLSIFTTVGAPYELGRTQVQLAQLYFQSSQSKKALTHIKQAIELFQNLSAQGELMRISDLAAQIEQSLIETDTIAPQLEPASDITLFKRLSRACITSEILLQEFGAIVREILPIDKLFIIKNNAQQPMYCVYGMQTEEALKQLNQLTQLPYQDWKLLPNALFIRLPIDEAEEYFCYFELKQGNFKDGQLSRLELYCEFIKIGLEKCRACETVPRKIMAIAPPVTTPYRSFNGFIYASPAMHAIVEQIKKIRTSDATVLITGESGTGKELIARAIHAESARHDKPFIAFNCTAAPIDLLDSQLFGHRRGSFTGAISNYQGIIGAAKGGTIFLDEIGDFNLDAQPKLLRFLDYGEIQPIGVTIPSKVDVRVIAATNVVLEDLVKERRFREDLYYRLNIININLPPLRDRREEIPILVQYYIDQFSSRYDNHRFELAPTAMQALQEYHWPGNIRQLRNEVERLFSLCDQNDTVTINDLSPEIHNSRKLTLVASASSFASPFISNPNSETVAMVVKPEPQTLRDIVDPFEKDLILDLLKKNSWNISQTAKALGISRRGLRLKIKRLGI